MNLSRDKLLAMLEMQAAMNAKVNPDWLTAGYPFLRAVVIEGAEAIEHMGWKWWKKQTRDVAQLQMELVDIWHFALSHCLTQTRGEEHAAAKFLVTEYQLRNLGDASSSCIAFSDRVYNLSDMDELSRMELLIGLAVARRFHIELFGTLLADAGMTWDTLYTSYIGKNVLNFFRQDNGYKQGTYLKIWAGREDNEHLTEILLTTDQTAPDFKDQVYQRLAARYQQAHPEAMPA